MKTKAFRPTENGKMFAVSCNRNRITAGDYAYRTRRVFTPGNFTPNQVAICRIFGQLHYLGSHAPAPIRKKWRKVERRFCRRYFGDNRNQSSRFANKHTAHSWL